MTHIKTPDEKNLTIQFFDLEDSIEKMIKETSEINLINNLKLNYDNVFINFSSGGSFSYFDPESIDIPSFTGNINIKVWEKIKKESRRGAKTQRKEKYNNMNISNTD